MQALAAGGVGLWSWDIARDVVTWDDNLDRLVGVRPKNAAEYVALLDPDDRGRVWGVVERALAGAPFEDVEHRFRGSDGAPRWVLCKGRVERTPDGRPIRLLGATVDITERHLRHERLVSANRLEGVARLAGGIAHDFNNMLTVILGSVSLIEGKLAEDMPDLDEVRSDLAELRLAAEQSARLTAQLLTFAGLQVHQPRSFDLDDLVREAERALRPMLPPEVELALELGARTPVHADPLQIDKVLSNLVVNARDALPSGGRILIATRDHDDGNRRVVRLTVSDNGIGIRPEYVHRVFEPFFTTRPAGMATGLGLATCHGIVEQNRGAIGFDTRLGVGTTFRVDLPVSAPARGETALPTTQPAPEQGGPAHVLVVEDEPLVRTMTVRSLERYGFVVHAAPSGHDALAILQATAIDVVVSDLVMPGMSGQELAGLIRNAWPSMRILFVSGHSDEGVAGIELLQKPFTPAMLAERVTRMLGRRGRAAR
ncbi:MAG: response regulator [Deltaproteobacteria bacterium]|nr:response regulator [Deltaproteobacteria bacterium]